MLGFKSREIDAFENNSWNNLKEQACEMLVTWWRMQPNKEEAGEWLRGVLTRFGRPDLASMIPGIG